VPIYEYKCENGHVFDVIQSFADAPLTECEECGVPAARVLHSPAVHFKGSGFYNTDYGKKKAKANGAAVAAPANDTEVKPKTVKKKSAPKTASRRKAKPAAPRTGTDG